MLNTYYNAHKVLEPKTYCQASVHKKVVSHPECGPLIGVGSVILLKEVVVFKPNPDNLYINITLRNIVKV